MKLTWENIIHLKQATDNLDNLNKTISKQVTCLLENSEVNLSTLTFAQAFTDDLLYIFSFVFFLIPIIVNNLLLLCIYSEEPTKYPKEMNKSGGICVLLTGSENWFDKF